MQKHLRQTERHLKERTRGEQRRKYPISELVTVTALTEERGESFIKAAHDFMTVTYLYCFDLNCLEKKRLKNTHTRIQACTCISLNNLLILQEKPRKHFYLGYISKMPRQQQAVPSTFLESFTSLIKSLSKLRYVKQELQWVQLHPSSHTSFFSKHKKKGCTNPLFLVI